MTSSADRISAPVPDGAENPAEHGHAMDARVDAAGVVRLTWAQGRHITAQLACDALVLVNELNTDGARPLLVDITGTASLTREARMTFAAHRSTNRIALLGSSAVDRVIGSFSFGASTAPTRYFTSETAAVAWLLDHDPDA